MDHAVRFLLGSGPSPGPGWIRVSDRTGQRPDLLWPFDRLPMAADGTVEAIVVPRDFVCLARDPACAALREWHRVLRPGGMLSITVPDAGAAARLLATDDRPLSRHRALTALFGGAAGRPRARWGWTGTDLREALEQAGFTGVRIENDGPSLTAEARRPATAGAHAPSAAPDSRRHTEAPLGTGALLSLIDLQAGTKVRLP